MSAGGYTPVAIDGANVYWPQNEAGTPSTSEVMAVPKTGGVATVLATETFAFTADFRQVAVGGSTIYWFANHNIGNGCYDLYYMPVGGGAISSYSNCFLEPGPFVADATNAYFEWEDNVGFAIAAFSPGGAPQVLVRNPSPEQMAVDANALYWGDPAGLKVWKLALSGGAPSALVSNVRAFGIALVGATLYYADYNANTIGVVPSGGGPSTVLVSGLNSPTGIATDGVYLYTADSLGISRYTMGGTGRLIVPMQFPQYLVGDSTGAYWLNADGVVYRLWTP
jgi:hypothetical protein